MLGFGGGGGRGGREGKTPSPYIRPEPERRPKRIRKCSHENVAGHVDDFTQRVANP